MLYDEEQLHQLKQQQQQQQALSPRRFQQKQQQRQKQQQGNNNISSSNNNNGTIKPWSLKQILMFTLCLAILTSLFLVRFEMVQTSLYVATATGTSAMSNAVQTIWTNPGSSSSSSSSSSSDDSDAILNNHHKQQQEGEVRVVENIPKKTNKEDQNNPSIENNTNDQKSSSSNNNEKVVTTTKKDPTKNLRQQDKDTTTTTTTTTPNTATLAETTNRDKNKTKKKNPMIKQISLIGERNSGTKWIWEHLHDCFNHSIPVYKRFTRYKHWFQDADYKRYPHDTLVLAQFRNPYDWLRAMQRIPHHAPAHLFLDWETFLTKPWTTQRMGKDLLLQQQHPRTYNETKCQEHFLYRDAVSCTVRPIPPEEYGHKLHYSEDQPFYELRNDGSGIPYNNIMEMRTDKIRNFLNVSTFPGVAEFWVLQYEFLLQEGTQSLLDRITKLTGIASHCDPYVQQLRRARNTSDAFIQYVNDHIDWTVEQHIGYEQRIVSSTS